MLTKEMYKIDKAVAVLDTKFDDFTEVITKENKKLENRVENLETKADGYDLFFEKIKGNNELLKMIKKLFYILITIFGTAVLGGIITIIIKIFFN